MVGLSGPGRDSPVTLLDRAPERNARPPGTPASMRADLTDHDIYLFRQGAHCRLYEKLGAHPVVKDGRPGVLFAVWAPNAQTVSVVGSFNDWDAGRHRLTARADGSGIWQGFVPDIAPGSLYKFHIASRYAELVSDNHLREDVFGRIRREMQRAIEHLLVITGQKELLESNPSLARSFRNRVPYIDPLNHLQVEALRRYRSGSIDDRTKHAILLTINGIAAGLRNSG